MPESVINSKQLYGIHTFIFSFRRRHSPYQQWHNNILHNIVGWNQLVILKNEADFLRAIFVERRAAVFQGR